MVGPCSESRGQQGRAARRGAERTPESGAGKQKHLRVAVNQVANHIRNLGGVSEGSLPGGKDNARIG